jgi:hypothetical protein
MVKRSQDMSRHAPAIVSGQGEDHAVASRHVFREPQIAVWSGPAFIPSGRFVETGSRKSTKGDAGGVCAMTGELKKPLH